MQVIGCIFVSVDEIHAGLSKLTYNIIWPPAQSFPEMLKLRVRPWLLLC